MTKKQKILVSSILLIAMFQYPNIATSPAVHKIQTEVFSNYPLSTIQTVMAVSSISAPLSSLLSSFLIRRKVMSKRFAVIFGVTILGMVGVLSALFHTKLWFLGVLSGLLGLSGGFYVTSSLSILIDSFDGELRQKVTGLQALFVSAGGVLLSIIGGLLVEIVWYGSYAFMMIALPLAAYSAFAIPRITKETAEITDELPPSSSDTVKKVDKSKFNIDILYYVLCQMLMFFFYLVCNHNISVHLARSGVENYSVAAGFASAFAMGGSVLFSSFFKKMTQRFGDMLIVIGFLLQFVGYTLLNLCDFSIILMMFSVFLVGSAQGTLCPQCTLSVSKRVDETTSTLAMALVSTVAAGAGGFLSPVIITNVTEAIAGDNTNFRYQFTAFLALATAIIFFILNKYRAKKQAGMYD